MDQQYIETNRKPNSSVAESFKLSTFEEHFKFHWDDTKLLGQSKTCHAREFKEAWYSIDYKTINRHIDIPTAYLQLIKTYKPGTEGSHKHYVNNKNNSKTLYDII